MRDDNRNFTLKAGTPLRHELWLTTLNSLWRFFGKCSVQR